MLGTGLPDDLTVFHGVHWTRIDRGTAVFGEIDFVIVAPSARVVLVEQKSGFLGETAEGLVKKYSGRDKLVSLQIDRTLEALRARLAPVVQAEAVAIDYLLYCPDYTVKQPGTAGLPPERIVDERDRPRLCARILQALPAEPPRDALAHKLRRFFENELQLVPDVSALLGRAEQMVTRLSGGLATWARRLQFDPFRLRVVGTAGSGKTQLALAVLQDAAVQGRRARYVCFNRPLADHLSRLAPEAGSVTSFHQWCDRRLRDVGEAVDYRQKNAFAHIEERFGALPVPPQERFDDLVIDEGQDFQPAWTDALLRWLLPGGRLWWLGLRDAARRHQLPQPARRARLPEPAAGAGAADRGGEPACRGRGRVPHLCGRGVAGGRHPPRRDAGAAVRLPHRRHGAGHFQRARALDAGDLLIETVYRFKGQSAPCVVLTGVDFDAFDELARRKLFVGFTRASMKLLVVLSERAARALLARVR